MITRLGKIGLGLFLSLSLAGWASAATLTKVEWQRSGPEGAASLSLEFDTPLSRLEARVEPDGLSVWLPGAKASVAEPKDVRITSDEGGARLWLEGPGVNLRSVRVDGNTMVLEVLRDDFLGGAATDYRLGVGDVVAISVYREEDLSGETPVSQDGTIRIPLVGSIRAAGLTEQELAQRIRDSLTDFLVDPQVSVTVKTYESQFVYVTGAVARAQRIALRPGMTLKAVLSEAGVALFPGQEVTLTRTGSAGGLMKMTTSDLDAPTTPRPRDGDVLTVVEPEYIFIRGEVTRPGKHLYTPEMTLQQAITLAEGLTDWASKKDVRILRKAGDETVDEVVNLKKVESRKIPDPKLRPGDLVLVRRRLL